jgi:uncharacterized protein YndB with AHSA1/START domain
MTSNPLTVDAPEGLPFVDFTRPFDAPVAAVFRAYEDPELVAQWVGPDGYEMVVEEYDLRSGGRYRYVHRTPAGAEFAFHGVFHTVRPGELVIQTFEFEGVPDVVSIESVRFEDLGEGRTLLRGRATYPSLEARDGIVESGMERGLSEGYARLDALLTSR